jgi:hypothetical protein
MNHDGTVFHAAAAARSLKASRLRGLTRSRSDLSRDMPIDCLMIVKKKEQLVR